MKNVGRARCKTWRWNFGNPRTCGLPAPDLEDDEGRPVCVRHHAQLEIEPDPEPLYVRALRARRQKIPLSS